ncbi:MAG: hypothetical protein H7Z37_16810, partial [Pyrinomonadaceae bacterium]|nr:hypothetical protein [Pyrinomonadaceae bacterium]
MNKNFKILSIFLSVFLCFAGVATAQERTGNLEGTVKDTTGAIVPNVSITIQNFTSSTDASGTGGGITNILGATFDATLNIDHSTISGNTLT